MLHSHLTLKVEYMDMESAAVFMSASILIMMTFVVISVGIIVVNNLFHKYWKPVTLFTSIHSGSRFASAAELDKISPQMDPK